jgi:photosystem I subunit XI
MVEARYLDVVKPFNGDPFDGHLSTPISDSVFTRNFIGNLPIYRNGLSPILRGLEIGMAHGYFLLGPWIKFGPLRDEPNLANFGGLVSALAIVLLGTAGMAAYGIVTFQGKSAEGGDRLETSEGWSELTSGFFVGGMGGALFAYFLLENFSSIDAIFRGLVN